MPISIKSIDKILPQTQCTKCGYKDCLDYASAIQNGEKHNRCPPGGDEVIYKLSSLLQKPKLELNQTCGQHKENHVAIINEDLCIGCEKCILACPVDAIIGTKKLMHTVIEDDCTGCELCITPCPMDCIEMVEIEKNNPSSKNDYENKKDKHRNNHIAKLKRLEFNTKISSERHKLAISSDSTTTNKKLYIQKALAEFKHKKNLLKK